MAIRAVAPLVPRRIRVFISVTTRRKAGIEVVFLGMLMMVEHHILLYTLLYCPTWHIDGILCRYIQYYIHTVPCQKST